MGDQGDGQRDTGTKTGRSNGSIVCCFVGEKIERRMRGGINPHGTQLQWRNRNTKKGRLPRSGAAWRQRRLPDTPARTVYVHKAPSTAATMGCGGKQIYDSAGRTATQHVTLPTVHGTEVCGGWPRRVTCAPRRLRKTPRRQRKTKSSCTRCDRQRNGHTGYRRRQRPRHINKGRERGDSSDSDSDSDGP